MRFEEKPILQDSLRSFAACKNVPGKYSRVIMKNRTKFYIKLKSQRQRFFLRKAPFGRFLHLVCIFALLSGGCSSIGKVTNVSVLQLPADGDRYSFANHAKQNGLGEIFFILAFSGGGSRAAALSYGALEELKSTHYELDGQQVRLLDEVDRINSVSGGSFTAAYYGLFGEKIFKDFKKDFLYKDIQGEIESEVFNVFHFMGRQLHSVSRTEDAIKIYDEQIFKGKTFADMQEPGRPFILINTTDLNSHDQFVFSQDYFDFVCSDLSQFNVARATAASSAVPVLFEPILLENHHNCNFREPQWLTKARQKSIDENNLRLKELIKTLDFYLDPTTPPYLTLVDGGVTDNLGLRSIFSNVMLYEGTKELQSVIGSKSAIKHIVMLVVNASTTGITDIGKSREMPSILDVLTAVTDIQLHRYNLESNSLLKRELIEWTESLSGQNTQIEPYFIELSIDGTKNIETHLFFNKIPTGFYLEKDQVDRVIDMARQLLRQDPAYKRLLLNIGAERSDQ
jgi:NTE family protein